MNSADWLAAGADFDTTTGSAAGAGCDMTHNSVPGGAMQPAASTSTMLVGFIPGSSSHESHGGTKGWAFVNHILGVVFVS